MYNFSKISLASDRLNLPVVSSKLALDFLTHHFSIMERDNYFDDIELLHEFVQRYRSD